MNVYIVTFRVPDTFGVYSMVVVAHSYDEAEINALILEPNYEVGSVQLIDPALFTVCTIVRTIRYIE